MLKGVTYHKASKSWRARVRVGHQTITLGYRRTQSAAEQLLRDHMSGDFSSETHLLAGRLGYSLQQTADLLERCRAAGLTPPRLPYDPSIMPPPPPYVPLPAVSAPMPPVYAPAPPVPPIPPVPAVRASAPPPPIPSVPAVPTPDPVTIRYESLNTASLVVFGLLTYGPMPLDEAENHQFAAVVRNVDRLTPAVRYDTLTGMWTDGDEWAPDLDTLLIDATVKPV